MAKTKYRRGASATELAVVLPFVVLFTIAVADLARFAAIQCAVCEACCRGARFGATRPHPEDDAAWRSELLTLVRDQVDQHHKLDSALLQVDLDTFIDDHDVHRVVVHCEYPFVPLISWPGVPPSIPLSTTLSLRRYR